MGYSPWGRKELDTTAASLEVLEKAGKHQDFRLQKRTLSLGQPCWDSSAPFPVPTLFHSTQVLYLREKELDRSRTDHTPVFVNDGGHRNYMCGIKPKIKTQGFPLAIQWLRLHSSNAGVTDLIPGQETKIPYAMQYSKKKKKKNLKLRPNIICALTSGENWRALTDLTTILLPFCSCKSGPLAK